jgi:hypothetical protein
MLKRRWGTFQVLSKTFGKNIAKVKKGLTTSKKFDIIISVAKTTRNDKTLDIEN